jgi:Uma2 family endonuclease
MSIPHHSPVQDVWGAPLVGVRVNESFEELVRLNPELRLEQTSTGEVIFMSPTGGESGYRNSLITAQLTLWAGSFGGRVFDSSTLFQLPNGAKRSPDASWISEVRWQSLSSAERKGFPPLCPDFVVDLRSESDRLLDLQEKMVEYVANGAQLGWLIDPLLQQVHIYLPGRAPKVQSAPSDLSGEQILPGFTLDLRSIWQAS